MLNLALSARPRFRDSRLDADRAINLGRGLDELITSVRQRRPLPEHPSIAWHEPTAVDAAGGTRRPGHRPAAGAGRPGRPPA
jgi:hypothetical protein